MGETSLGKSILSLATPAGDVAGDNAITADAHEGFNGAEAVLAVVAGAMVVAEGEIVAVAKAIIETAGAIVTVVRAVVSGATETVLGAIAVAAGCGVASLGVTSAGMATAAGTIANDDTKAGALTENLMGTMIFRRMLGGVLSGTSSQRKLLERQETTKG